MIFQRQWSLAANLLATLAVAATGSSLARVATYVESESSPSDPDEIAVGFPVPIARDQSEPFAGFRSLNGIETRLDDLALQAPGARLSTVSVSRDGRPIRMICFGPASPPEVLITGGVHAREWAAPEAVLGLAEAFVFSDQPLVTWVAENTPSCLAPILNPDGFAQSQRENNQTRVCEAPEDGFPDANCNASTAYPRDGRMRRKNLRDSDGNIDTSIDALLGVDLNRNLPPHWATGGSRSSNDAESILYHGPTAASESEVSWLSELANNSDPDLFRLYVDVHSFSRLYFWNCTGDSRLDQTAQSWVERFRLAARQPYANVPTGNVATGQGCGNFGIGATDELFSFVAGAPAYTLELEPSGDVGAAAYGGNGISHSGFLLPEAIVPAMRKDAVQMLTLAASMTAGPAWLQSVQVNSSDGIAIYEAEWQGNRNRTLQLSRRENPTPGASVSLLLKFDRPMRWNHDGNLTTYPGQSMDFHPQLTLVSEDTQWPVATNDGAWVQPAGAADTQGYQITLTIPSDWPPEQELRILVNTRDNANFELDSHPATAPQWRSGAFDHAEFGTDGCHIIANPVTADSPCSLAPTPSPIPAGSSGSGGSSGLLVLGLLWLSRLLRRAAYGATARNTRLI